MSNKKDTSVAVEYAPFEGEYSYGVGRRKNAVATVRLYADGEGKIVVNGREFEDYFPHVSLQQLVKRPIAAVDLDKFNVSVKTQGGGVHAQAEAVSLGISRALVARDEELRTTLKKLGLLSRDARKKERKKPGLKGARRAPQFSKR